MSARWAIEEKPEWGNDQTQCLIIRNLDTDEAFRAFYIVRQRLGYFFPFDPYRESVARAEVERKVWPRLEDKRHTLFCRVWHGCSCACLCRWCSKRR